MRGFHDETGAAGMGGMTDYVRPDRNVVQGKNPPYDFGAFWDQYFTNVVDAWQNCKSNFISKAPGSAHLLIRAE